MSRHRFVFSLAIALIISGNAMAQTVLITGANSGLGLEFARQYAAKGWHVIATHRRSSIPETLATLAAEHDNVRIERMDVTNEAQVHALAEKLATTKIDVLINNAGVYNDRSSCQTDDCPGDWSNQNFGKLDYGLLERILAVNVKGPLLVSETFEPLVAASEQKKIIVISSTNGSLTEETPRGGAIFYRASKSALNRSFQLVASALKPEGITVIMLHPGAVLTERQAGLAGYAGMVEMPFTVEHMINTIGAVTLQDSGHFINYDGTSLPW
ncbi:MAG: SDR family oxidoreductase [Gammaproteobacteria bacterium]|nr:SDR family oxidoreductase [Gammaproteobacteria bacterium]